MQRFRCLFVVVLCMPMLLACSSNQSPTPAPTGAPTSAETVGGGGNLFLTLGDDPDTLDPALIGDASSAFVARQLFSGLMRLNEQLEPVPDLAESVDLSADKRTYTFKLRADAQFADGTPITAEDVRWSLERATDPQLGAIVAATYLDDILGVTEKLSGSAAELAGLQVIDDRTLAITLREPSSLFLLKISNPPAFVIDRRAVEQGGQWFEHPNGSGPFMIDRWEHRQRLELVPNPRYAGQPAKLDRVTFLLGALGSNPLGLYENGEVDLAPIGAYSRDRISSPEDPLHAELRETPQLSLDYIAFNTQNPPFDDPKVREAFSLLIDRVRRAEVTFNGTVIPARGILPPGMPGADPAALPEPTADIARAKQLLAESSYGGTENLPPLVGYTSNGGVSLLAQIAHDELGVTIELRSHDQFGDYLQALTTDTDQFHMYDLSWIADYPDPQNFLEVLFGQRGQYNYTGYRDAEFEQLLAQAKAETDEQRRGELYRQAEQRLLAAHVVVPLDHTIDFSVVKPYVQDLTITPQGLLDLAPVSLRR